MKITKVSDKYYSELRALRPAAQSLQATGRVRRGDQNDLNDALDPLKGRKVRLFGQSARRS